MYTDQYRMSIIFKINYLKSLLEHLVKYIYLKKWKELLYIEKLTKNILAKGFVKLWK